MKKKKSRKRISTSTGIEPASPVEFPVGLGV